MIKKLYGLIAILGLLLMVPQIAIAKDRLETTSRLLLVTTTILDFSSSLAVEPPARERNPLMGQNKVTQALVMTGSSAGVLYLSYKLPKRWQRIAVLIGVSAAHSYAAAHNWRIR